MPLSRQYGGGASLCAGDHEAWSGVGHVTVVWSREVPGRSDAAGARILYNLAKSN